MDQIFDFIGNPSAVAAMVLDSYRREVAKRTIIARTAGQASDVPSPGYASEPHVSIDGEVAFSSIIPD